MHGSTSDIKYLINGTPILKINKAVQACTTDLQGMVSGKNIKNESADSTKKKRG